MKFYTVTKKTHVIASINIDVLLGLENLQQDQKDKLTNDLVNNSIRYFLQEKIGSVLTDERKEEIVSKYTGNIDIDKLLQELGDEIPNAAELFTEASLEIKANTVSEYYTKLKAKLEANYMGEQTDEGRTEITRKLKLCNKNLEYIQNDAWDDIISVK